MHSIWVPERWLMAVMLTVLGLQFPERVATMGEVQSAVRGTQQTAQQAQDAALASQAGLASAKHFAIIGMALGALGTVMGVGVVVIASRKR